MTILERLCGHYYLTAVTNLIQDVVWYYGIIDKDILNKRRKYIKSLKSKVLLWRYRK